MPERKVKCQVITRVCGYFADVSTRFNNGKVREFNDRLDFDQRVSMDSLRDAKAKELLIPITKMVVFTMPMCNECQKVKAYLDTITLDFPVEVKNFKECIDEFTDLVQRHTVKFKTNEAPAILIYRNGILRTVVNTLKDLLVETADHFTRE